MERTGLPTVFVTPMSPLAQAIGANRIVRGKAVPHPWGDPTLDPAEEREFRSRIVEEALDALNVAVESPTVFEVGGKSIPGQEQARSV